MMSGCQCRSPATTVWLMLNNVSRLSPKVDSCLLKGSMVTICGKSLGSFFYTFYTFTCQMLLRFYIEYT